MFFLMLVFSIVPLGLGLAIQTLFGRSILSKSLFIFMVFIGVWQLDVAILFAHNYFPLGWIDFLFRLFRFGSIMLPPSLLYVTYAIYRSLAHREELSGKWAWVINRKLIIALSVWSMIVYAAGWTQQGIQSLLLVESQHYASFLFPVYGSYSWIFNLNVPLFFIVIGFCFFLSLKVSNSHRRSFLVLFSTTSIVAYSIGTLNMSQQSGLYPSSIAVLIFAIAVFIGFCFMHANVVKEMNRALMNQKEFLRTVIDTNPSFIYTKNEEGALTLANLSLANMYGETIDNIVGRKETDFIKYEDDDRHGDDDELELLAAGEGVYNLEQLIVDHKGSRRWVQTAKIPIDLSDSRQLLCVSTDITERKEYEQRIMELAYHDTLTGLPNRRSFNQMLNDALNVIPHGIVLMFIDLDRFKIINDTLGHSAGDQFLTLVARRLQEVLNGKGDVFRIGGDEFVVMLTGSSHPEAVL
ncbi:diguanylate cyclase, partial [Paenibacillus sepulcri]|nr:diguanylate cyclase [Paenibacillus sepulcri]